MLIQGGGYLLALHSDRKNIFLSVAYFLSQLQIKARPYNRQFPSPAALSTETT